jgi:DNA invertase Pin-like site-specific DNA recombinase
LAPRTYEVEPPSGRIAPVAAKVLRVAAYCRVSTYEEQQAGSFESQVQYFIDKIRVNPAWGEPIIFSDEGISGTSVAARKGFQAMIEAAKNHEIDEILTKDMSRFGRNSLEILTNLKTLNELNPPVPVIFEIPGISSLDPRNNLLIAILSALAELESQQKSESIKNSIRYRMTQGIYKFSIKYTLGYYRDHFGVIKVEPGEAEIVRYIYESFLEGVSPTDIARSLTEQGVSTPKGMAVWSPSTIRNILRNEKYNGDCLYQKYTTISYLTHKTVRNRGPLKMIMSPQHHPPIIDMDDWLKVQEMLNNWRVLRAAERAKPKVFEKPFIVPRIKSGTLKGYYLLDGAWTQSERQCFLDIIDTINNLPNTERM